MQLSIEELKQLLKNNVVTITFDKVNGEERVLKGTLLPEFLPANEAQDTRQLLTENTQQSTIRVFDVEKNAWRSFRLDSVKSLGV